MANQHFSQHSTGPRTAAGKTASSQNAAKHHLTCTRFRMTLHESEAEYQALKSALYSEHQPVNVTESMLVELLAQSFWLIQRAIRCASRDGATEREVALMMRYQTTHDRAFHKALAALTKLQAKREAEERGEPELARANKQLDVDLKRHRLAKLEAKTPLVRQAPAAEAPPEAA